MTLPAKAVAWVGALLILAALAAPRLEAQQLPLSSPPAGQMITGPVNEQRLVRLKGSVSLIARASRAAGLVPPSTRLNHILLVLKRSPAREQALDQFMREQYDPNSPNFHRWLTPAEFGNLYGPSSTDVAKVTSWLKQQGFTVNRVSTGDLFIDFSGTAAQVEAALHTPIRYYRIHGRENQTRLYFANQSAPMIPASLTPVVSGFRSLSNFHPRPMPRKPAPVRMNRRTGKWEHMTSGPGPGAQYLVGPQDYAEIYGVNQVWAQSISTPNGPQQIVGTGETIGVAGDTDLTAADIESFRDQFGITALGPDGSVVVDHPPTSVCSAPTQPDPEGYIDAEWAGAMAPNATIDFVTCGDQGATSGADLAAAYMIQDPAHAARISVLSTSYGFCEANPISETAQFYVSLWQQAAAEGITVVVAAGDAGGAECDEFAAIPTPYASSGLAVDAEASTPYNIAAGGTDFSDVFSGTVNKYWSADNGPYLESAKSYIPETPWDETCASPLVLAAFGNGLDSSSGPDGFCSVASRQPIDPNTGYPPFFSLAAGAGGLSNISPMPAWQAGVAGVPATNRRALPDISMFASSGIIWGHALVFCDSALLPAGTSCDFSSSQDIVDLESGGTSFVAPAFAGIMALIDQKYGRQGQADNVLYPLARSQYANGTSSTEPSLATCAAYLGPAAMASCYFHDIGSTPNPNPATQQQTPFITGTTSVPCSGTATAPGTFSDTSTDPASNWENCYGYQITVQQSGSSLNTAHNYFGILSTSDAANSPAFPATPGYNMAAGLGSPNAAALISAPEWSGLTITNSSLPDAFVGSPYSEALSASGRIPPYNWAIVSGSLPGGLTMDASGQISGTPSAPGTSTFSVEVSDSETPPASATIQFSLAVIAPAATSTTLSSSAATAGTGEAVTFTAAVSGGGTVPTGSVTFLNGATTLGTATLENGTATLTTTFAATGTVSIHAVYGGDPGHLSSQSNTISETIITPGISISLEPASMIVSFGGSGQASLTVTPRGGFTGNVSFSCGTLPANLSCSFAPPSSSITASGSPVTSVLTVNTTSDNLAYASPSGGMSGRIFAALALWPPMLFLGLFQWERKRRRLNPRRGPRAVLLVLIAGAIAAGLIAGCGGHDRTTPDGTYNVPVLVTYSGGSQSANLIVQIR